MYENIGTLIQNTKTSLELSYMYQDQLHCTLFSLAIPHMCKLRERVWPPYEELRVLLLDFEERLMKATTH